MSDVTFTGGNFGFCELMPSFLEYPGSDSQLDGGNQQFTAQRLTFNGCKTAVQVIWDWGWVWKSITVTNADVGFRLVNDDGSGNIGSASFMDSTFNNVKQAIVVAPISQNTGSGTTGIILDNVGFKSVGVGIADTTGKTLLSGASSVLNWVIGPVYNGTKRTWSSGQSLDQLRELSLLGTLGGGLPNVPYFERAKPQYESSGTGDFVHLKDLGCAGKTPS